MADKNIFITQPDLPDIEEFFPYLKEIWQRKQVTNNSKFHQELEQKLAQFLGVKHVSLFANGTLALMVALKSLDLKGEVITTPFSFVATSNALLWNNLKPIFVDIDHDTLNLNPEKIEKAITKETTAILPVHVYGNPCDVKSIKKIAQKHNLSLIYDAAHAFGTKINNKSILNYGDLSILSFHATKIFNTIEGGAIICHNKEAKKKIDRLKNFGIVNKTTVEEAGINAKMNELQAAMGLLQLKHIKGNIKKRKEIAETYRKELKNINGISLLEKKDSVEYNYGYFPILIDKEKYGMTRDELYEKFKQNNIHVRRYFYPLISDFSPYKQLKSSNKNNLPIANDIANKILCLPIYPELEKKDIERIINLIR